MSRNINLLVMNCFGVRCVIEALPEEFNNKKNLYEERITVWRAENIDDAIDKATEEVEAYCKKHGGLNFTGLSQAYWMVSEIKEDGIEVFSLLRDTRGSKIVSGNSVLG